MVALRRHPYLPVFMDRFLSEDVLIHTRRNPVALNEALRFAPGSFLEPPVA